MRLFLIDIQPLMKCGTLTVDPAASGINISETECPTAHVVRPFFWFAVDVWKGDEVSTFADLTLAVCAISHT